MMAPSPMSSFSSFLASESEEMKLGRDTLDFLRHTSALLMWMDLYVAHADIHRLDQASKSTTVRHMVEVFQRPLRLVSAHMAKNEI